MIAVVGGVDEEISEGDTRCSRQGVKHATTCCTSNERVPFGAPLQRHVIERSRFFK
jgi:hypothetical protein